MAKKSARSVGVEVDGLTETLKALNKFSKVAGKEARDEIREVTKRVQLEARAVDSGSASEPRSGAWIGRSVLQTGAAIVLRASAKPRALSTEFGSYTHDVYGRDRPQRYMRRRTWQPWRRDGYVIQPTIKRLLPWAEREIARRLDAVLSRSLDKAGVPRKGRAGR